MCHVLLRIIRSDLLLFGLIIDTISHNLLLSTKKSLFQLITRIGILIHFR